MSTDLAVGGRNFRQAAAALSPQRGVRPRPWLLLGAALGLLAGWATERLFFWQTGAMETGLPWLDEFPLDVRPWRFWPWCVGVAVGAPVSWVGVVVLSAACSTTGRTMERYACLLCGAAVGAIVGIGATLLWFWLTGQVEIFPLNNGGS